MKNAKKKILVIGLSSGRGGIESFFHTYYKKIDPSKYIFDFVTIESDVAFSDEYTKNGSKIFDLPNYTSHPIRYYNTLRKIIRKHKYNIVHINMLSAANILPLKAARKEKVKKIVIHSHNSNTPSGLLRKFLHFINKRTLRKNNVVKLACGEKAGKWLFGKDAEFQIINNAIDVKRFKYNDKNRKEIRTRYSIKDNEVLLGNVGRLYEQKNQVFLLDVLKRLDKNYKLMLVGDGDKKKDIKKRIGMYSLEDRVIIINNTPEIEKYYSAFDIFVFPSLFEGAPVAPIEAQTNGLNCIISNSVTSEINLGKCKYLPLDDVLWYDEIRKSTSHGRNNIALDNYNIEKQYKKMEKVYDEK